MLALPRQNTIMPHYQAFFNEYADTTTLAWILGLSQFKNESNRNFRHEYNCQSKYVRPCFPLLVDKGLIKDVWTSSGINLSYHSTCTRSGVSITLVKIWREIKKKCKICWRVIQLNRFIQQVNIHSSGEPNEQNVFGWFSFKGFLTVNCWNNRIVKVESATGKTVHKLFVGGVGRPLYELWMGFNCLCNVNVGECHKL